MKALVTINRKCGEICIFPNNTKSPDLHTFAEIFRHKKLLHGNLYTFLTLLSGTSVVDKEMVTGTVKIIISFINGPKTC